MLCYAYLQSGIMPRISEEPCLTITAEPASKPALRKCLFGVSIFVIC